MVVMTEEERTRYIVVLWDDSKGTWVYPLAWGPNARLWYQPIFASPSKAEAFIAEERNKVGEAKPDPRPREAYHIVSFVLPEAPHE